MSENEYPSNSMNQPGPPPPRRREAPIITNVRVRKKPMTTRVVDRSSSIWQDVFLEVIRPYAIDLFAETFHGITDRIWYGQATGGHYRGPRPGRPGSTPSHVSNAGYTITDYSAQYQNVGSPAQLGPSFEQGARPFDFSVIVFDDYARGREIIDRLMHIVTGYHQATVNDLYDLLGMSGTIDNVGENYGWPSLDALNGAEVRRVRGGKGAYYLDIPDARPLPKR